MVTITSLRRDAQQFNVLHRVVCASTGKCGCDRTVVKVKRYDAEKGIFVLREVRRANCVSFRLGPKERREGLPDSFAALPEVRTAKDLGRIKVVFEEAKPVKKPAKKSSKRSSGGGRRSR